MDTQHEALVHPDGSVLAAVTNEIVRIYKEQFGRGPTRARTDWAGLDGMIVVLEETMTTVERRLRDMGEHQRLRDTRLFYQHATLPEFVEPVERLTGRTVRGFISGIDTREDISTEHFIFYPNGVDATSRSAAGRG
jgi:uncharacterized protein YbcI